MMAHFQKILKARLSHHVPCGINVDASDIQKRIKEGWRYVEIGGASGGLTSATAAALGAGRAAAR